MRLGALNAEIFCVDSRPSPTDGDRDLVFCDTERMTSWCEFAGVDLTRTVTERLFTGYLAIRLRLSGGHCIASKPHYAARMEEKRKSKLSCECGVSYLHFALCSNFLDCDVCFHILCQLGLA